MTSHSFYKLNRDVLRLSKLMQVCLDMTLGIGGVLRVKAGISEIKESMLKKQLFISKLIMEFIDTIKKGLS